MERSGAWKSTEISDDEDDTHPSINTPSLFSWRHQLRRELRQEHDKKKKLLEIERTNNKNQLIYVQRSFKNCNNDDMKLAKLYASLRAIHNKKIELDAKFNELLLEEKRASWNVDTVSNHQQSRIKKTSKSTMYDDLPQEEKENRMRDFLKDNKNLIIQFGMLRRLKDSQKFLMETSHLIREATANYLIVWCLDLELKKKSKLMEYVAHQCICMQFILDMAKQLETNPRACIAPFFEKIQLVNDEYKKQFDLEVESFKEIIKKRTKVKIENVLPELEKRKRPFFASSDSLDPLDVFNTLPESLQKCFSVRDVDLLRDTLNKMPEYEASYFLDRCIASGLWVPDSSKNKMESDTSSLLIKFMKVFYKWFEQFWRFLTRAEEFPV